MYNLRRTSRPQVGLALTTVATGVTKILNSGLLNNVPLFGGADASDKDVQGHLNNILRDHPLQDSKPYLLDKIILFEQQLPIAQQNAQGGKTDATRQRGKAIYQAYMQAIALFKQRYQEIEAAEKGPHGYGGFTTIPPGAGTGLPKPPGSKTESNMGNTILLLGAGAAALMLMSGRKK